jgi:hypothetical protein
VVVIEPRAAATAAPTPLAGTMFRLSLPGAVQQVVAEHQVPAVGPIAGKTCIDAKPTAYACLGPQCSLPVMEPEALLELLRRQRTVAS